MRRVKGIQFSFFQNLTRSQRNAMISSFKYSCFRIVLSDHTHSSACGLRYKLKYHTWTNNLQRNCWDTSEWECTLIVKVAYIDNSFPSFPYQCCFAAKKAWWMCSSNKQHRLRGGGWKAFVPPGLVLPPFHAGKWKNTVEIVSVSISSVQDCRSLSSSCLVSFSSARWRLTTLLPTQQFLLLERNERGLRKMESPHQVPAFLLLRAHLELRKVCVQQLK